MNSTLKKYLATYLNEVNEKTPTTFAASLNEGGTPFEDASNLLQIGVFGPKDSIQELLVIMRILVDERYDLLDDFFADLEEIDYEFKYENLCYDDFVAKFSKIATDSLNEQVITASELKDLVDDAKFGDGRNWRTRRPNISSVFWKASDLAKHLDNVSVISEE